MTSAFTVGQLVTLPRIDVRSRESGRVYKIRRFGKEGTMAELMVVAGEFRSHRCIHIKFLAAAPLEDTHDKA